MSVCELQGVAMGIALHTRSLAAQRAKKQKHRVYICGEKCLLREWFNNKSSRRVFTPLGTLDFQGKARYIIYASEHLFDKILRNNDLVIDKYLPFKIL